MSRRVVRPFLLLAFLICFLLLAIRFYSSRHSEPEHTPLPPYLGPETAPDGSAEGFLPLQEATTICGRRRLPPYQTRSRPRKVYDLFLINTELDYLEIRLRELYDHVDAFIINESPVTFQQTPKPLYLTNAINEGRFDQWKDKIVHRVVNPQEANPKLPPEDVWAPEHWTRNQLLTTLTSLLSDNETDSPSSPSSIAGPQQGDILLVSDVDEIPSPATISILRNCAIPPRVTLRTHFYYYSYQWRHRGPEWKHPQATYFQAPSSSANTADLPSSSDPEAPTGIKTPTVPPEDLRMGTPDIEIWGAGWHCSSCFRTLAEFEDKIQSFSHSEFNIEYFLERERLIWHVRNGEDMFEREGEVFDRVDGNEDVPGVLRPGGGKQGSDGKDGKEEDMRKRFAYMLDRDGANAGFEDL